MTTLSSISSSKVLTLLAIIIPVVTIGAILIQLGYFLIVYFKMISSVVFYKFGIPFLSHVAVDAAESYISNVAGFDHEVSDVTSDVIQM